MSTGGHSPEFIAKIGSVTNKRAKAVIQHILEHGSVTTEQLKDVYGYNHPPRAARDVREQGILLDTFYVKGKDGRRMGACRFADTSTVRGGTHAGRRVFPKEFKAQLIEAYGCRCGHCLTPYESRYLQIDHRIPYEVAGDSAG